MPRLEDDLAASFRQGTHLAQRDPAASPEALLFGDPRAVGGACFALAALWVVRHMSHRGEGPAGRAAYLARENTITGALAAHRAALDAARQVLPPETPGERYRQFLLARQGLGWMPLPLGEIRGGLREAQHCLLHASLASGHSYHFLALRGDHATLGHAMTAYTAGPGAHGAPLLYLFDPNWGEFKVSARHAPEFTARLLGWYDGHRDFGRIAQLSLGRVVRAH